MVQQTVQSIIDELRAGGASDNAIRGILANVKDESGFKSDLRHADQPKWGGEAHYAHGLYQEGGSEWNNYSDWLKQNGHSDWTDPALQTRFLAQNLKSNYPDTWESMNKGTPEQAAQSFVSGYLKPAKQFESARRAQYAQGVPELDAFTSGAPASATTAPAAQTDPFQSALADFSQHMGGVTERHGGTGAPGGAPGQPGGQMNPQQALLGSMMQGQQQAPAQPQQANYGGIPSPNYAAAGSGSNGTANLLKLMMNGRQQNNMLALLTGQVNQQNPGTSS